MSEFRKKPVVIEAFRLGHDKMPDWFYARAYNADGRWRGGPDYAIIKTLEGEMRAEYGDWIIKGVKGELYPCKPDIFEATYESASAAPAEVCDTCHGKGQVCIGTSGRESDGSAAEFERCPSCGYDAAPADGREELPVKYYQEGGTVFAVYGSSSIHYVEYLRDKLATAPAMSDATTRDSRRYAVVRLSPYIFGVANPTPEQFDKMADAEIERIDRAAAKGESDA